MTNIASTDWVVASNVVSGIAQRALNLALPAIDHVFPVLQLLNQNDLQRVAQKLRHALDGDQTLRTIALPHRLLQAVDGNNFGALTSADLIQDLTTAHQVLHLHQWRIFNP